MLHISMRGWIFKLLHWQPMMRSPIHEYPSDADVLIAATALIQELILISDDTHVFTFYQYVIQE